MKKPILPSLMISTLLMLSGCQTPPPETLDFLAPLGAPSLTLYQEATNPQFLTNASVPVIKAAFFDQTTDVIIIDHQQGLGQIIANKADFQLARIVTKGNLHLVGINQSPDAVPDSNDHIITFGTSSSVVNQVLFYLYPDLAPIVTFVSSLSDIAPIMTLGRYDNRPVDYVLMAEPLLSKVLAAAANNPQNNNTYDQIIDIQAKWLEVTGLNGYPQAGVFIRTETYTSHPELVESFLENYDLAVQNLISASDEVATVLNQFGDSSAQNAKFGIDGTTLVALQSASNRLGFSAGGIDLAAFNLLMENPPLPEDVFSPLYQ